MVTTLWGWSGGSSSSSEDNNDNTEDDHKAQTIPHLVFPPFSIAHFISPTSLINWAVVVVAATKSLQLYTVCEYIDAG